MAIKHRIVCVAIVLASALFAKPVHMVELEFRQRSFTLSISQHIKDAMNAFSITIPTTEEFYNSVKEGQELGSKFKGASFMLNGNIGSRVVTVKRKYILEDGSK